MIGAPLERYINSVKKVIQADSRHSENPKTIDILRRIVSSLPEPQLVETSALNTGGQREREPQNTAYLNFHQVLNEIGLSFPEKDRVSTNVCQKLLSREWSLFCFQPQENAVQFTGGRDDGERIGLPVSLALPPSG